MHRRKRSLGCAGPNLLKWEEIAVCQACDKQGVCALFILCQYVNLFGSALFESGAVTWQYVDTNLIKIYVQLKLRKQGQQTTRSERLNQLTLGGILCHFIA
jgi:enterochelin esterase-like enzyme